jgi:hypothetical protein
VVDRRSSPSTARDDNQRTPSLVLVVVLDERVGELERVRKWTGAFGGPERDPFESRVDQGDVGACRGSEVCPGNVVGCIGCEAVRVIRVGLSSRQRRAPR